MHLLNGDCLDLLRTLPACGVDAMVTDPPAGISFSGHAWDGDKGGRARWVDWMASVMREAARALKPGAHGLVWALPRTSHWTATALEDAGFEIRDVVTHHFGNGFPKYKYALKPATENWILVRKPPSENTADANVAKWGVGGLNIDACRIPTRETWSVARNPRKSNVFRMNKGGSESHPLGRWPANLVLSHHPECSTQSVAASDIFCHDDCPVRVIDVQSGGKKGVGASRYFYIAKASPKDRGEGNVHPTVKSTALMEYFVRLVAPPAGTVLDPFMGSGSTGVAAVRNGYDFIGIEANPEYFAIAERRVGA